MIKMHNALLLCAMILVLGAVVGGLQGCAELQQAFPELNLPNAPDTVAGAERPKPATGATTRPSRPLVSAVRPTDIREENCKLLRESYGFPLEMQADDTMETQRRDVSLNNAYMCTCLKVMDRPDGLICGT